MDGRSIINQSNILIFIITDMRVADLTVRGVDGLHLLLKIQVQYVAPAIVL